MEPQINADERRFANTSESFIQAFRWLPIDSLCALCVLCGEIKTCTAESAKNAKGGLSDG